MRNFFSYLQTKFTFLRRYLLILLISLTGFTAMAQRKCGTATALQQRIKETPSLQTLVQQTEQKLLSGQNRPHVEALPQQINIPVVVHVVLDDTTLVTTEQILSQIQVLNTDYNALNPDQSLVPAVWQSLIGNTKFNFCLAQRTPAGEPTNGIVKVKNDGTVILSPMALLMLNITAPEDLMPGIQRNISTSGLPAWRITTWA